ncbi:unnamed protein product [Dibothriocephalus latus]|uniref:TRAPPC10/Trs130 N-terminal domain-containing protein n=1 Tax=Dibothriocephalus latus TaxID=60516 RepID=A0A3P6PMP8_DIBLA|nr:unnamed protein product [Dibothriocephalus latus]
MLVCVSKSNPNSGEPESASIVEKYCTSSLTAQPIEWSRNPSLVTYTVHVDPTFMPLDTAKSGSTSKGRPTKFSPPAAYVFICPNDPEYYTSKGKADLKQWLEFLSTQKVNNSLIVTISNKDKKVPAKSSVLHKLKMDFMIDASDRLVDVPTDFQSASGAWQSLLSKMRNLILRALGSKLDTAENTAKSLLASHSEADWDFMDFLDCQEEIATLYSCLNLSEEAMQCLDKADHWLTSSLAEAQEGGTKSHSFFFFFKLLPHFAFSLHYALACRGSTVLLLLVRLSPFGARLSSSHMVY